DGDQQCDARQVQGHGEAHEPLRRDLRHHEHDRAGQQHVARMVVETHPVVVPGAVHGEQARAREQEHGESKGTVETLQHGGHALADRRLVKYGGHAQLSPGPPPNGRGASKAGCYDPGPAMKILVVDDHPLYRSGVVYTLQNLPERVEVVECSSVEAAFERMDQGGPVDLMILDLQMPGYQGIDMVRAVRHMWPVVHVIVCFG